MVTHAAPTPDNLEASAHRGITAATAVMDAAWRSVVVDMASDAEPADMLHPFDPIGLYVVSMWHSLGTHMQGCRVGPMNFSCGRQGDPAALVRDAAIGLAFQNPKVALLAAMQGIPLSSRSDVFASARWLPYQRTVSMWTTDRFDAAVNTHVPPRDTGLARLRGLWLQHVGRHLAQMWATPDDVYHLFRAAIRRKARQTRIPAWKLWAFLWHAKSAVALRLATRGDLSRIHALRRRQSENERDNHDRQAATMAICEFDARIPHGHASIARPFHVLDSGKFAWDCCRIADDVVNRYRKWERSLRQPRENAITGLLPSDHASLDDLLAKGAQALGPLQHDAADAVIAAEQRSRVSRLSAATSSSIQQHLDGLASGAAHVRALREFWRPVLLGELTIAEAARRTGCQRSNLSRALGDLVAVVRSGQVAPHAESRYSELFGT